MVIIMINIFKNNIPNPLISRGREKLDFLPQQNLRKERDIRYKIKLIYSVLIKKISSFLSVDYYKSNNENQFKDIQLQLHATKVTNPYTFSIQGNKSFSGICELKSSYVIAYGSEPWYCSSWSDASKVSDLTTINGGVKFNVKNATDLTKMFRYCSSLTSLDLSNFDTSKVISMGYMFDDCSSLTSLDLSNFDTSNVTNMRYMFGDCYSLTSLDLSSFNTSNVTDMYFMFFDCSSLTSLDLSSFNTSNVTDMNNVFNGCSKLTSLDLSNFNTSKVTDMHYMFYDCSSLTSLDLSSFDTSKVTDMSRMFNRRSKLDTLDYSLNGYLYNNGKVPDFSVCTNLKTIRLHHVGSSTSISEFIRKSKVPSTCKVIQVS